MCQCAYLRTCLRGSSGVLTYEAYGCEHVRGIAERDPTAIPTSLTIRDIALLQPLHPDEHTSPSLLLNESVVLGAIRFRSETPHREQPCLVPSQVDLGVFDRTCTGPSLFEEGNSWSEQFAYFYEAKPVNIPIGLTDVFEVELDSANVTSRRLAAVDQRDGKCGMGRVCGSDV